MTNHEPAMDFKSQLRTGRAPVWPKEVADLVDGLSTRDSGNLTGDESATVAFLEGPAVDRRGNVFFSNIPAERILKWDPQQRRLTVFREKSNQANGLMIDRQGRLVTCEGGGSGGAGAATARSSRPRSSSTASNSPASGSRVRSVASCRPSRRGIRSRRTRA